MSNEAGKGDKVANDYRTKKWEESKLWENIKKKQNKDKSK